MVTEKAKTTTAGAYTDIKSLYRLKYQARGFSFLPRQPARSLLAGRHGSKLRGRGLNFEELRQYRPGDDVRAIDWKVTARTGKPHTRIFTEERDRQSILVVDQRPGMFFGSQRTMKSVAAAELASLAAWRILAAGDRVGGFVFNATDTIEIRPNRSEKTVLQLLRSIVKLNTLLSSQESEEEPRVGLNEVLKRVSRTVSHDMLVIIISDLRGADAETRMLLTNMARHNNVVIGFISDPLEEAFPDAGSLVASDFGLQLEFDSSDEAFRSQYTKQFEQRLDQGKKLLLRRRIPVLNIKTDEEVFRQLSRLLGAR
ncbi:MAG: DUF58 domain-containing protein [Sneathiella sp.]|uniref:DUF58 domain-containing protein n=1 Tax=Sneathiella sp. TaxID=1964365 RepID=UPI003001A413